MRLAADNPMRRALAANLGFEIVVAILALPGMIWIDNVTPTVAVVACSAAAVLAIAALLTLRRPPGYPLAWLTQVAVVALGVLSPLMYLVGGMFALLWVIAFVLGRRIERQSAERMP